jgi:predicted nuclease with RNAse H fold
LLGDAAPSAGVVMGVDLAAGRGVTAMATLQLVASRSAGTVLTLHSLGHAPDDDAIVAEVIRERPGVIALDAPLSLPAPVAAALAGRAPDPNASPYTRAAERAPIWSQLGIRPLPVSFLGGLTFRAIPLAARLRASAPASEVIEVFPSGALAALGLRTPSTRGQARRVKTSADVRRATHSALARIIEGLSAPANDEGPLDADSLDAIAAALTAALFTLGATQIIGDEREGCIIMPSVDAVAHLRHAL